MARAYADGAYLADDAAISAIASVKSAADMRAVQSAVHSLYLPWLKAAAEHFQKVVGKRPLPAKGMQQIISVPAGECIVFADGLRFDLGQRFALKAEARGLRVGRGHRWAALPTVTATAKPAASPIAIDVAGCAGIATLVLEGGASVNAPSVSICANGDVAGDGTLNCNVVNAGRISPGLSPQTLNITGLYTQTSTGNLDVSIASYDPYDHVSVLVGNTASFNGTLNVTVLDQSSPAPRVFGILNAASVQGSFVTVNLPPPAGEFIASLAKTATSVTVNVTSTIPQGARLYVRANGSPQGTGSSWPNALTSLQAALDAAQASGGAISEVWVASGTYVPTYQTNPSVARSATFKLLNGVALYGGFIGNESDITRRDFVTNVTILSGDLNGNDGSGFSNNADNAYHVITADGTTSTAILDGFTIRGGNANIFAAEETSTGGGLRAVVGGFSVRNCRFEFNWANGAGGGIWLSGGHPTIGDCKFTGNNSLTAGGGIYGSAGSHPTVNTCAFILNTAGKGGASANVGASGATFSDCSFDGNSTPTFGGAVSNEGGSNTTLRNCHFSNNSADTGGGALSSVASNPTVLSCTFSGNSVGLRGGAIFNESNNGRFVNCSFIGNISATNGGAMFNRFQAAPLLINCLFSGNFADRAGGAVYNQNSSVSFASCTLASNTAHLEVGGGFAQVNDGSSTLHNCIVWGNTSLEGQGGQDAQIYNSGGNVGVEHCCVQGWNGTGQGNIGAEPRFVDGDGADNIPGTDDDDLRLFYNSPCIDAADNALVPSDQDDLDGDGVTNELTPFDLDAQSRFIDDPITPDTGSGSPPICDMGAFEFDPTCVGCPGDRLWVNTSGGAFENRVNWFPQLPVTTDGVVFDLNSAYAVTFAADAINDHLIASNGDVTFNLAGHQCELTSETLAAIRVGVTPGVTAGLTITHGTVAAPSVRIGGNLGSVGVLVISGADAELQAQEQIVVGDNASGSLHLSGGSSVWAGAGVQIHSDGAISGSGTVQADLQCAGSIVPGGTAIGGLTVSGDYAQSISTADSGPDPVGDLSIQIGGTTAEIGYDVLHVSGTATLAGTLGVTLENGFTPAQGDSFRVVTAGALAGRFALASLPALPGNLVMNLNYDDGSQSGQPAVVLTVDSLSIDFFTFDDPMVLEGFGPPSDAKLVDLDGDGDRDVLLSVPNANDNLPGTILVFRNAGMGAGGIWNGFETASFSTEVGREPVSVTTGHFNNDPYLDIAVANRLEDTVTVLLNTGDGMHFDRHQVFQVLDGAVSVAAGKLYENAQDDLVVLTASSNRERFFMNDGAGNFSLVQTVNVGSQPHHVSVADVDHDGDPEVVCVNFGVSSGASATLSVTFRNESTGQFMPAVFYNIGDGAVNSDAADLNNDNFIDVMTANQVAGSASMLLNIADGTGGMSAASNFAVGAHPSSVRMIDLDGDGDLDLAIAAEDVNGNRVVRLKRNNLDRNGQLSFTDASPLLTVGPAQLVLAGDVNLDQVPDLLSINYPTTAAVAGGGSSGATLSIHVNQTYLPPVCLADMAPAGGDGVVNVADLLAVIIHWGPCAGCAADIAPPGGNGVVSVADLLAVINAWGPCP